METGNCAINSEEIHTLSFILCIIMCCLFQMKIHSPSPHKQVPSKCNDYFFNYFTLGVVRKLALGVYVCITF